MITCRLCVRLHSVHTGSPACLCHVSASDYGAAKEALSSAGAEPAEADKQPGEGAAAAVDDDVNAEDDEAPEEDALAEPVLAPQPAARLSPRKLAPSSIAFLGAPVKTAGGKSFYK